jgi:hypothetical protein
MKAAPTSSAMSVTASSGPIRSRNLFLTSCLPMKPLFLSSLPMQNFGIGRQEGRKRRGLSRQRNSVPAVAQGCSDDAEA